MRNKHIKLIGLSLFIILFIFSGFGIYNSFDSIEKADETTEEESYISSSIKDEKEVLSVVDDVLLENDESKKTVDIIEEKEEVKKDEAIEESKEEEKAEEEKKDNKNIEVKKEKKIREDRKKKKIEEKKEKVKKKEKVDLLFDYVYKNYGGKRKYTKAISYLNNKKKYYSSSDKLKIEERITWYKKLRKAKITPHLLRKKKGYRGSKF